MYLCNACKCLASCELSYSSLIMCRKAAGIYVSRCLSYHDAEFDTDSDIALTNAQMQLYDRAAE